MNHTTICLGRVQRANNFGSSKKDYIITSIQINTFHGFIRNAPVKKIKLLISFKAKLITNILSASVAWPNKLY